jgi:flagellar motor switch protein FliG
MILGRRRMSRALRPPQPRAAPAELRGVDKVTALLLTMGKPLADRIVKQLDNREIRLVAKSASSLPLISPELVDRLIDELTAELDSPEQLIGSPDDARGLISGAVNDEQASEIMSEVKGTSADRVWSRLADAPDEKLASYLSSEQPQIAAVIISRLETAKASAVMELLSRDQRADLSRRLLQLKPIADSALRLIADRLSQELFAGDSATPETDRHARLAAILNKLERIKIVEVLKGLDAAVPDDARRVREHVFCFEDIAMMTPEDRALLFDAVPSERTVMAMRGVDQALGDLVMQSISPRARRIVEAELSTPAKVARKSIVQAQLAIAELAQSMAAKSLIRLRPESGSA